MVENQIRYDEGMLKDTGGILCLMKRYEELSQMRIVHIEIYLDVDTQSILCLR